jgi:hypothetical protein
MKVKIKCKISIRIENESKGKIKIKDKRIVNGIEQSLVLALTAWYKVAVQCIGFSWHTDVISSTLLQCMNTVDNITTLNMLTYHALRKGVGK